MKFVAAAWTPMLCLSLLLGACGGTSSSGSSSTSTAVTYTSAATVGELLDYTIDTTKLTYSYTIEKSRFGLDGQSGSGALVDNGDGTYSPQGRPNTKIFPVQNGMLVGAVKLTINGTDRVIPLIGFKNLVTSLGDMAGTYNYVRRSCSDASPTRSCSSDYGTFHINSGGTWTNCVEANYDVTCTGHAQTSGTLTSLSGGMWQVMSAGSVEIGTGLVFHAPNGQNVWVIDLDQPTSQGGAGIGMLAGSSKGPVSTTDTNGTWVVGGTNGTVQYAGTLTVSGNGYTAAGVLLSGSGVLPIGGSSTITHDDPWDGMVKTSGGGEAILAGTGMYAGVNPTLNTFSVGLRK